ncbi:MAG: hypothetical protein KIT43_00595 [Bauldia sp.]|nr:hypothetical protein [Bauldia sp.]
MSVATHDRRLAARFGRFMKEPGKRLHAYWLMLRGAVPYHVAYALRRPFAPEPRTLHFFPGLPAQSNSTILRVCKVRGIRVAVGTPDNRPLMYWEDETVNRTPAPPGALNGACTDIRKSTVDRVHREVFGYSAAIDPFVFDGAIVEKSEENAARDGVILAGPLASTRPGKVYQRLISNNRGDVLEELRIAVVFGTIPHVVICWKAAAVRFVRIANRAGLVEPSKVLSAGEMERIAAFCAALGLDCGELDAIRDPADGRLYILDANKTPIGPARVLPLWQTLRSVALIGQALDRLWLRPDGRPSS